MYYLYILECSDKTLYTGITTDLKRRLNEHNQTKRGAKYTRLRRPCALVFSKKYRDRSLATKAEYSIKRMARIEKIKLFT